MQNRIYRSKMVCFAAFW